MRFNTTKILTLLAVFLVIGSGTVAAAGIGMNTDAEEYPKTYIHEDQLTIEKHDRATMDWLEYEDDNGNVQMLDAFVNGSVEGAKVSYRADQVEDPSLGQFPRTDAEENNSATWLNTSKWSAGGQNSTGISTTDTDGTTASGVDSVQIATDGTFASGDTAYSSYTEPAITNDAEKRYMQLIMNVKTLEASSVVEVQVRDGGGDYVRAVVNSSRSNGDTDVITNATGNGVIYQEQLGQLAVKGSGDGTLDAVEEVRVVVTDGDATATVTGLNVQKKSRWDFGEERVPDTSTDDTDDYKAETVYNNADGGRIDMADLSGLGSEFDDAVIHKLRYIDLEYRMQDKPSAVTVSFPEATNYGGYDFLLDLSFRRTIASAYDITHGNMELRTEQSLLSERYTKIRYAEGVGDTDTEDISDSSWIDVSGSLNDKNTTIVADSTTNADTTYVFQIEAKLLEDQKTNLEASGGSGGFWGNSGGGNPFMSFYNWLAGGVVALLATLGLSSRGS